MKDQEEPPIPRVRTSPVNAAALLKVVETSLDDDKAEDVVVIDLDGKTDFADYMVIASGRSQRMVGAMTEHLRERIKKAGTAVSVEGEGQRDWVLVDAGDVIVHLFRPEVREFYSLEKLWGQSAADRGSGASGRATA